MEIDLARLREMHPRLPEDLALVMVTRAALGLQRNGHETPVDLVLQVERVAGLGRLAWPVSDAGHRDQHDFHRITEDGAEAIALALMHGHRGWTVVRRMQREERADWLLEHADGASRKVAALEVSGVDRGGITGRLSEKLAQVACCVDVDHRWAGVVGFEGPVATLRSAKAGRR